MKRMLNEPTAFREEMIEGFCAAYGRYVWRVPGASGVASNGAPVAGRVAVVIGGGSGHYPAFCGLVGEGLAAAAVIGDIFTSPSGEHAYRVARAVEGGAGVLFSYGNYSGDVMNFGLAESRLRAEGIDCRTILVTDDVLSAPPEEVDKRRGIAGGFFVFKTAGASAARGDDLATVEALARHANQRLRTVGVAFAGCTIPGQTDPLFTVADGMMEVGLGIHGEPGVRTGEVLPAKEIARLMVDTLLADAPADAGSRAVVLVNGLGSTKYEELFVLYQGVAPLLERAGIDVHEAHVGEFVTSLDMAGCSLTLFWLDDELQMLHDAPASSPAFTRFGPGGAATAASANRASARPDLTWSSGDEEEASGQAGEAGARARAALAAALAAVENAEGELGRLDAAAGDGDHGAGMARGFRAAIRAVDGFEGTARQTWRRAGRAFQDTAGGASGALVGAWLTAIGDHLPDDDHEVDAVAYGRAFAAALETVKRQGGADVGDKTMVDTLHPFVRSYEAALAGGSDLAACWASGLVAAETGMRSTAEMVSRLGRASRLGERSRGVQDPGATSIYYVLRAFGGVLAEPAS